MGQRRSRRAVVLAVTMGLLAAACDHGGDATTTTTDVPTPIGGNDVATADGDAPRVFGLQLSEGQALLAPAAPNPRVDGDALGPDRVDEITTRLPEWLDAGSQHQSFRWPVQTTPPPRTGNTMQEPFPPVTTEPVPPVDNGPLTVLRFQPEGDVLLAPYVAITFNQPMVPVGTVGQVNGADVPVTITPALEGSWQWIGTRTLRFDHESGLIDRLPMATNYTVTVPAGTTSATGGELAEAVSWQFTTPPPAVQSFWPSEGDSLSLEQLFTVTFDQRVDPPAVLATIHLRAGDDDVAIRLATPAEIEADDQARQTSGTAEDGRWLTFRP
ncbi:MAG: Ig-like domain-containing protein, partial [Ilumatobacteraceae bacterium]